MKAKFIARSLPAAMAAAVVATLIAAPASAQSVSVTLDGSPVGLNPPPITRNGRVFVPLRGIFERLDASVVYSQGTIEAQGGGRSISLHIGSTDATVDGHQQMLDVAPFIVGESTYVPLRFISQALGDQVNYDSSQNLVAIVSSGPHQRMRDANNNGNGMSDSQAPAASSLRLRDVSPGRDSSITGMRPSIEAQFANINADPNTLRVSLDGTDVTSSTMRSPTGFVFSPPSDLQSMQHTLRVTGRDTSGAAFDQSWQFNSGHVAAANRLSEVSPSEGATVGSSFTVRGRTMPGARVVILVGAVSDRHMDGALGAIFGMDVRNVTVANSEGYFSSGVSINAAPGAALRMTVNSTDARTNSAATPVTRILAMR